MLFLPDQPAFLQGRPDVGCHLAADVPEPGNREAGVGFQHPHHIPVAGNCSVLLRVALEDQPGVLVPHHLNQRGQVTNGEYPASSTQMMPFLTESCRWRFPRKTETASALWKPSFLSTPRDASALGAMMSTGRLIRSNA